jgi:hypothetical protein
MKNPLATLASSFRKDVIGKQFSLAHRVGPYLATGLIIVMTIIILGNWHLQRQNAAIVPPGWRTYHDPSGLFSLAMPRSWQVSQYGSGDFGNNRDQASFHGTFWQFGLLSSSNTSYLYVVVEVYPIVDAMHRQYLCKNSPISQNENAIEQHLGNIGAYSIGNEQIGLLAQNAYFVIRMYYPGMPTVYSGQPSMRTPVPSNAVAAGRQLVEQVAQTFRAIPDQGISC